MSIQPSPNSDRRSVFWLAAFAFLALALTSCDDSHDVSENEFLKRAQEFRQAGDLRASVIELKNALQKNPDSARARLLLGQLYVDIGDGASGEKELVRAKSLGMDPGALIKPLARAWLQQKKYQKVLDETQIPQGASPLGKATALTLRGHADLGLRKLDAASRAYEKAIALDAGATEALVGLGKIALVRGDIAEAEKRLAAAEAIAEQEPYVKMLKGDISFAKGEFGLSGKIFGQLVKSRPNTFSYRISLARAQIAQEKYQDANATLDPVLKAAPNNVPANYLKALAAFRAKDYQTAKTYVEKVLQVRSADLSSLLIGGASNFATGELEQAKLRLNRFLAAVPKHEQAQLLLGATLLRLSQSNEALERLQPLLATSPKDATLLALIGTAAVQSGDLETGSEYFSRAIELDPDNAFSRSRRGMINVALGKIDEGIDDLKKAAKDDPSLQGFDTRILLTYLQSGKFAEALTESKKVQTRYPDSPFGYTAAGLAHAGLKDFQSARASFRKALKILPGAPDASSNLALLFLRDNDKAAASDLLKKSLEAFPGQPKVSLQYSLLVLQDGNLTKAISILEDSLSAHTDALPVRIALARAYLLQRSLSKAIDITEQSPAGDRDNPALLDVRGRAQIALGHSDEAILTYNRLVQIQPKSARNHERLAAAYEASGNLPAAENELRRALELDPDHGDALSAMTLLLAKQGKPDEASATLEHLRSLFPKSPKISELEGDIALSKGRFREAIAAFETAQEQRPSSIISRQLAFAKRRVGDTEGAVATLESWLKANPTDNAARLELAALFESSNALSKARDEYSQVVATQPGHWVAWNNLASVELKLGETDKAKQHIKKALERAPEHPGVMDTYGEILAAGGEYARAIRYFERALRHVPKSPVIRYHLAMALAGAEEPQRAEVILEKLLSDSPPFKESGKAEKLLQRLRAK